MESATKMNDFQWTWALAAYDRWEEWFRRFQQMVQADPRLNETPFGKDIHLHEAEWKRHLEALYFAEHLPAVAYAVHKMYKYSRNLLCAAALSQARLGR